VVNDDRNGERNGTMNVRRLLLLTTAVAVAVLVPSSVASAAKHQDGVDVDKARTACKNAGGLVVDEPAERGGGFRCYLPDGRELDCTAAGSCTLWEPGECGPGGCVPNPNSSAPPGGDDGRDPGAVGPHGMVDYPGVADEPRVLEPPRSQESDDVGLIPDVDRTDSGELEHGQSQDGEHLDDEGSSGRTSDGDGSTVPGGGMHMQPTIPDDRELAPTGPGTTTTISGASAGAVVENGQLAG
jgi:hypothetical protein